MLIKTQMALWCLLFIFVAATSAQDQKLNGNQIIERHIAAIGGREALAKFKTRVALGTLHKEDEAEAEFAVASEAPNRLSVVYLLRDYDLRISYDGKSPHITPSFARQYAPITGKYEEIVASGAMFNQMSLYNLVTSSPATELQVEAKGTKKIAGRQTYVVQLKTNKGSFKLYFDVETFMWIRTDFGKVSFSREIREFTNDVVSQAGGEVSIDFYIETSDFRDVDGVKLPFQFVQVMTSPIMRQKSVGTITGTVREYRNNVEIDPKMFQ